MPAVRLRSEEFRREREAGWRELERLVGHGEKVGLRSLSSNDLTRIPRLYRAALSSLSVARAISLDRNLVSYLEGLCARSYVLVYGTKGRISGFLSEFFLRLFPGAVQRHRWQILFAALFMFSGVLTGFALTMSDADHYYAFVSKDAASGRTPGASTSYLKSVLYDVDENPSDELTYFATMLFTHNSQVGILAFSLGIAAGVLVFFILFANGMMLGAMAALYHSRGISLDFWGWILPHGVTELLAVVFCGAAGLALGQSIVFPGRLRRLENLARTGRSVAPIVIGCLAMFFVAGVIEGIFRQTVLDIGVRYLVAGGTAAFWILYLVVRRGKGR